MMDYGQGDLGDLAEANRLTYKFVQVERDGSWMPHSDDEYMDVEHLLADPRNEMDFVDGVLNFDSGKCLENEWSPCPVDYQQLNADSGDLCSSTLQEGREDSKFEFVDGILRGADNVHLHIEDVLSNALDDYLLDEFSEKIPDYDYAPSKGPQKGINNLDNHYQGLNERNQGAVEISSLVTPTVSVREAASDKNSLDKMTMRELQKTFKSTFGRETSVKNKPWLKRHILFGLQSGSCLLESGISSKDNAGNLISTSSEDSPGRVYCSITSGLSNKNKRVGRVVKSRGDVSRYEPLSSGEIGASQRHKRLRRPTQRYIEESSNLKSRSCSGRLKLRASPRDELGQARSHNQHHRKAFGATPLVYMQDGTRGSGILLPFALHVRKRRSKRNASLAVMGQASEDYQVESGPSPVESQHSEDNQDESESSPVESQDESSDDSFSRFRSDIGEHRRKLHKMWTLSEVMLLVDGVSQYGVGRWTEIKRMFFSASAHRTSVDLKDKWRNLLRASNGRSLGKRKVTYRQKQTKHSIPQSVLRRVNELAIIYPYPRERKSKIACSAPVSTPMNSTCVSSICTSRKARKESLA